MANQPFRLWLEFEVSDQWIEDPEDDYFNMQVELEDGRKYAINVWTFKYFEHSRVKAVESGECLSGRYLKAPDLFVERLDRKHIEEVVADLIETQGLMEEWLIQERGGRE